ncbi:MAG TPA: hypothetical protein DER07_05380 [Armatimonadetes bacterium]|nr:hypothetical protein [Armatimonadota bacterium]
MQAPAPGKLFEADPREIAKVLFLAQQAGAQLLLQLQERQPVPVRLVRGPEPGIWLQPVGPSPTPFMGEPCCLIAGPSDEPWHIHTAARRSVPSGDGLLIEIEKPAHMVRHEEREGARIELADGELQAQIVQDKANQTVGVQNASWNGIGARFLRPLFVTFVPDRPARIVLGPGKMNLETDAEVRWFSPAGMGLNLCWPDPANPPEAWLNFLRRAAMSRLYRSLSPGPR